MTVRRYDAGSYRKPEITPGGFLKADAVLTRTGVFPYRLGDGSIRRELRLPEDVGAPESLASFQMLPVTDNHPPVPVNQSNVARLQRGNVGDSVTFDGHLVTAPILITDSELIAKVRSGEQDQISNGYDCDLEMTPGAHPNFGPYDAIQRNIVGNHVAVVKAGRAGPSARIRMDAGDGVMEPHEDVIKHEHGMWVLYTHDGKKKISEHKTREGAEAQERAIQAHKHGDDPPTQPPAVPPDLAQLAAEKSAARMGEPAHGADAPVQPGSEQPVQPGSNEPARQPRMNKIRIDGIDYEPEQVAQVLERRDAAHAAQVKQLEEALASAQTDGEKAHKDAETAAIEAKAELDKEIARADALKADLDKAEKARADATDPTAVQKLVAARVAIETQARRVLGAEVKLDGKDEAAIRLEMLGKLEPELKLDGKSPDYVQGRFDHAMERFDREHGTLAALRTQADPVVQPGQGHKDTETLMAERQQRLNDRAKNYRSPHSNRPPPSQH